MQRCWIGSCGSVHACDPRRVRLPTLLDRGGLYDTSMSDKETINQALKDAEPALFRSLSQLGHEAYYPPDIPFQAAEARGAELNATIGQITDGQGGILALPAVVELLGSLGERHPSSSLLYSPVEGVPELRRLWSRHHRPEGAPASTLPLVTVGLTEGLSLAADLFCDRETPVVLPSPFWGNYRQIFGLRRGGRIVETKVFSKGRFRPEAIVEAVGAQTPGAPVMVLLNFPSNPSGYSPLPLERAVLVDGLAAAADSRPLIVVCDDAYAGLVFEEGVPTASLFWSLAGVHPDLIPVKVDGVTKELVLFGARVGFLTFACERSGPASEALESKVKCLLRASVGSPVALSQWLVVEALEAPGLEAEVMEVHRTLARRYRRLRQVLDSCDPELLRPMPFNSGCFALVELPSALDAEVVRRTLLESYGTGVIAIGSKYVRIAYCSVREYAIPELVSRVEACVRKLRT